jgi:hypothetical protein
MSHTMGEHIEQLCLTGNWRHCRFLLKNQDGGRGGSEKQKCDKQINLQLVLSTKLIF